MPTTVLHIAETAKGGIASVLCDLIGPVDPPSVKHILLLPDQHLQDVQKIVDDASVITYRRSGRDLVSLVRLTVAIIHNYRRHRPNLVHLHSSFAGVLGRIALIPWILRGDVKIIYSPHGISFIMPGGRLKQSIYKFIERTLSHITSKVICVSKYELRCTVEAGLSQEKLTLIYNGVPSDFEYRREAPTPDENARLRLLFVGRFDQAKGVDIFLDAVEKLDKSAYDIGIIGAPVVLDSVLPEICEQYKMYGWLSRTEVSRVMRNYDLVVISSRWEAFGLVAVEALRAGVPVVAPNTHAFPEIITPMLNGFLYEPTTPEALHNTLKSLKPSSLRSIRSNIASSLSDRFTVREMRERTIDLYIGLGK